MKLMIDIPDNEEAIKKIVELCEYKAYNYTVLTDEVIKKIDNKALYKAIEALKNEPFLIDALHKAHAEIKEMERPQDKWISVYERLPEEEDYRPCYGLEDGCVMWQTDNGDIGFGWYYNSTKCWSDIYDEPIKTGKVVAWQPLPKPYEEADNE